jgi:hypothetical protein
VVLNLNSKHVDRVDKLAKARQLKLQQRARSPKVSERKSNYFIKQPSANLKYPKSQKTTPRTSPVQVNRQYAKLSNRGSPNNENLENQRLNTSSNLQLVKKPEGPLSARQPPPMAATKLLRNQKPTAQPASKKFICNSRQII